MAGKPINLNQVRKQKARAQKRARGDANAAQFGRSKAEKDAQRAEIRRETRKLDGHALEKPRSFSKDDPETP